MMNHHSQTTNDERRTTIHVLGVGSIGSLWAMALQQSGLGVTLLLRNEERLRAFQQQQSQLRVESPVLEEQTEFEAEMPQSSLAPITNIIVATKAYDTLSALQAYQHRFVDETTVLLLQNGMGQLEEVQQHFPQLNVLCGVTTHGVYAKAPFHWIHAGVGETWVGAPQQKKPQALFDYLQQSPLHVAWDDSIGQRLWHKLIVNSCINPVTAYLKCRNGALLELEEGQGLVEALCDEVETLVQAINAHREPQSLSILIPPQGWKALVHQVIQQTANNYSSMYQDLANQRLTEIDYITGYLLKQSQQYQVTMPTHAKLRDWVIQAH